MLDGRIRSGKHQRFVPILETHHIGRLTVVSAHFDDLALVISLPNDAPMHMQSISEVRHHVPIMEDGVVHHKVASVL